MDNTLLKEERIIINSLRKYHGLETQQLIKLIYNKPVDTAESILKGLRKRQFILVDEGGLVTTDPRVKRSSETINAFWVMLQFINRIKPNAHCAASYPANIFFIMENQQYSICVIDKGEETTLRMLFERACSEDPADAMNYIIVIPDVEGIDRCLAHIPAKQLDDGHIMFATAGYASRDDALPTVEFFKQE